ncbi:hypothetical protein BGZ65_010643, partial [Modicella reniformis]
IDATYADFVKRVADGRKMTLDQVENVAGGRIMNGKEALKAGLVDKLGGLLYAVHLAGEYGLEVHKAAGLLPSNLQVENIIVKTFPKPKPWMQKIVESMTGDEAIDMYAKEKIWSVMVRLWTGDMTSLMNELESSFQQGSRQLEMEEVSVQ